MRLLLLPFLLFFFLFGIYSSAYAAQKQFDISSSATYIIHESGLTSVNQIIRIKNNTEFIYTPAYNLTIGLSDLSKIKISDKEGAIPFTVHEKDRTTTLKISFQKRIIGIDKINEFSIVFETKSVAQKNGMIWHVYIPGLANPDEFSSYEIFVEPPSSFGDPSIVKPFKQFEKGTKRFYFNKGEVGKGGVALFFGEYQAYSYTLSYHLQNPNLFPIRTEIALPPDTSYQQSFIDSIEPKPENVTIDADGNWLASYRLDAQQILDILVKGGVIIRPTPKSTELTPKERRIYTNPQAYWDVRSIQIRNLASELATPKKVYDYVVNKLSYDYKRAADKDTRLGALTVLSKPKSSVCLEFTDLYVAVARASGIPVRAVEGYAFTKDSILRPSSSLGDVLHVWPEYYDEAKKAWVMIDPTWGKTTYGLDFFNSFDFDHIAFVIKGSDSQYPIPAGGYKKSENTKDVEVRFSKIENFDEQFDISSKIQPVVMAGLPIRGDIIIKNTGKTLLENKTLEIKTTSSPYIYSYESVRIPPFGHTTIPVSLAGLPFLTTGDITLTMLVEDQKEQAVIKAQLLPDGKTALILGGITFGFTIIFAIATFKVRRLRL